jgi:hypothetical protein
MRATFDSGSVIHSRDWFTTSMISLIYLDCLRRMSLNWMITSLVMYSFERVTNVDNYFTIALAMFGRRMAIVPNAYIDLLESSLSTSVTYSPSSFNISPRFDSEATSDRIYNLSCLL